MLLFFFAPFETFILSASMYVIKHMKPFIVMAKRAHLVLPFLQLFLFLFLSSEECDCDVSRFGQESVQMIDNSCYTQLSLAHLFVEYNVHLPLFSPCLFLDFFPLFGCIDFVIIKSFENSFLRQAYQIVFCVLTRQQIGMEAVSIKEIDEEKASIRSLKKNFQA